MTNRDELARALDGLQQSAARLLIAYSGGLDSQVLLQLASQFCADKVIEVIALHVNYGWSDNADDWQAFCAHQCENLGLEFRAHHAKRNTAKTHAEQYARDLRYQWFASQVQTGDVLLTAHHQDDQAETVVLRLMRASGARGLASIPQMREFAKGQLYRPLLGFSRQDLHTYAQQQGLEWVEDESNLDLRFDRNFVRHEILPLMSKRWPHAARQLARVAQNSRDEQALLDALAAIDLAGLSVHDSQSLLDLSAPLNLPQFKALSVTRQHNVLQFVLRGFCDYPVSRVRLNEWLAQVTNYNNTQQPSLTLDHAALALHDNKLHFLRPAPDVPPVTIDWQTAQDLHLRSLDCNLVKLSHPATELGTPESEVLTPTDVIQVHWRTGGERIRLPGEAFSRSLKKVFQERRVAPWLRNRLPLVSVNGQIVWSAAIGALAPQLLAENGNAITFGLVQNKHPADVPN